MHIQAYKIADVLASVVGAWHSFGQADGGAAPEAGAARRTANLLAWRQPDQFDGIATMWAKDVHRTIPCWRTALARYYPVAFWARPTKRGAVVSRRALQRFQPDLAEQGCVRFGQTADLESGLAGHCCAPLCHAGGRPLPSGFDVVPGCGTGLALSRRTPLPCRASTRCGPWASTDRTADR